MTCVLTQNVPESIFQASTVALCVLAELIAREITNVTCKGTTKSDFPSNLNRAVP